MCKACSILITKSKKVYCKVGVDSHTDLQGLFVKKDKELVDDKKPPENTFARIEISPKNNDYLRPDKWIYTIDERIKPVWLNRSYEKPCWNEFKKWKKEVYSSFNLEEALNPIYPFKIKPPDKITKRHIEAVKLWVSVGDSVGVSVWDSVGDSVGASVGAFVRDSVRASIGASVWASVETSVWASVWDSVGASAWASVRDSVETSVETSVWASVWDSVGASAWASVRDSVETSVGASVRASVWFSVGDSVWAYMGTLFPKIKKWEGVDDRKKPFNKLKGKYPFGSVVYLWKKGLVPSYYNGVWRLHGGKNAEILWEGKLKS